MLYQEKSGNPAVDNWSQRSVLNEYFQGSQKQERVCFIGLAISTFFGQKFAQTRGMISITVLSGRVPELRIKDYKI
jgi:hypothetical protein